MKYSLRATSIIESMIVLLVVVTGITWVYWLLVSSQKLADSTSNRIEAIQIARDWLEAFINIRDTNWELYGADYENCWNVLDYELTCIGNVWGTSYIQHDTNEGFKIYRDSENKFRLALWTYWPWDSYADDSYRNEFAIRKESIDGFYTQSGWIIYWVGTEPFYTRELNVDYIDSSWNLVWPDQYTNDSVKVTVLVQWSDRAKQETQKLEMSTILTNWKAKK